MDINKSTFIVEVPQDSIEYEIDDFLGNTLQYRIGEKWVYDTSIKLPINDLKILGVLDESEYINLDIDREKKWLKIKTI